MLVVVCVGVLAITLFCIAITNLRGQGIDVGTIETYIGCPEYAKGEGEMVIDVGVFYDLPVRFDGTVAVFAFHGPTHLLLQCVPKPATMYPGDYWKQAYRVPVYFNFGYWYVFARAYDGCTRYPTSDTCYVDIW